MSTQTKEQMAKLALWLSNLKSHQKRCALDEELPTKLKTDDKPSSFIVKINQIRNLKPPTDLATKGKLKYCLQAVFTLYSKTRGFFGRSQVGQTVDLDEGMKLKESDYALFITKLADPDIQLVIEYLLIVKEKAANSEESSWKDLKRLGIGFATVSLFENALPKTVELL